MLGQSWDTDFQRWHINIPWDISVCSPSGKQFHSARRRDRINAQNYRGTCYFYAVSLVLAVQCGMNCVRQLIAQGGLATVDFNSWKDSIFVLSFFTRSSEGMVRLVVNPAGGSSVVSRECHFK